MTIDTTHDWARPCWVLGAADHVDFPIQNLPFGVFDPGDGDCRIGVAIGDHILDLRAAAALLPAEAKNVVAQRTLNALFDAGAPLRVALRRAVSDLLSDAPHRAAVEPLLHRAAGCTLHLPAAIGDYTDFYTGIHHANNIGRQFRPDNPLLPNYKYVPIGYHGRSSSIRPSRVPVRWPSGQRKGPDEDVPSYGPARRMDYELELGVWIGPGNALGDPIAIDRAGDHIAGFCLLNDWSARDLQAWEYQPLGPFLAKNFHTTISPWVVTAEAMAPFRIAQPPRPDGDPASLDYLLSAEDQAAGALALELEVFLTTARMRAEGIAPHRLSIGPASNMYWTVAQMVTHHASNGCPLAPGDLLGTGTISTPEPGGFGSLMEISQGGKSPATLPTGETRTFLEPGDEVSMRATARAEGYRPIGFGVCAAVVG